MKYVLEPDNRNCPDDILLGDLRSVASNLGVQSLTKDTYNSHGRFSASTMQKRFGSWNSALVKSGLSVSKRIDIPAAELIEDLKLVASQLGFRGLPTATYSRIGKFSVPTYQSVFGSWPKALAAAGLEVSDSWHPRASEEDLLTNLAKVWEFIGRQPRRSDLSLPISRFSPDSYVRRFGSWQKALEFFVSSANQEPPEEKPASTDTLPLQKIRSY